MPPILIDLELELELTGRFTFISPGEKKKTHTSCGGFTLRYPIRGCISRIMSGCELEAAQEYSRTSLKSEDDNTHDPALQVLNTSLPNPIN